MSRIRWRLRPLLFTGAVALMVPVVIGAERIAEYAVRRLTNGTAEPFTVLADLRVAFAVLGVLAVILAFLFAFFLGGRLMRQLRRLRTETTARSRGERSSMSRTGVGEIQAAASAVDLLATELERRCDALAFERDELALLLNSVSEGILQVDARSRIVHANPAARALLGLRGGDARQPVAALVRNAELREVIERAADGANVPACEVTLDDRRLLVAARPLGGVHLGEGESLVGAVVAFTDLTEIRRLEGVRRDFVANVSHELKTPLTSIRGYVETLLSDELPLDMQRQFLEVIHKNAERLHGIVDDLLDLSRLESGGWRPEIQRVEALDMVQEVWNGLRDRIGRKSIEFAPVGEPVTVLADLAGLRQVLSNLFDNAIRYTPTGGRITARVARTTEGPEVAHGNGSDATGWVLFEIRDTGSGIPRDALPRIFERFYRVDPARSRAEGGTGLGLSIVRHLVESMGGDVAAESDLGKGTTLRVRLPAAST
jgi:two-component system phosphate regulon sensor histidine kinase PhoR